MLKSCKIIVKFFFRKLGGVVQKVQFKVFSALIFLNQNYNSLRRYIVSVKPYSILQIQVDFYTIAWSNDIHQIDNMFSCRLKRA